VRVLEIQSAEIKRNCNSVDPPVIPAIFDEPITPQAVNEVKTNHTVDDDESENLARLVENAFDLQAERILVSALRNMTGLVSFKFQWSRTPPLVDHILEDDVWTTLIKYCPNLREVNVSDGERPEEDMEADDDAYHRPTRNPAVSDLHV
jgi:hypothetical protein